jgi:hypothetical protein
MTTRPHAFVAMPFGVKPGVDANALLKTGLGNLVARMYVFFATLSRTPESETGYK